MSENKNVVLETRKLKKIYNYRTDNAFEALHDIDFQVFEGDFVAIMTVWCRQVYLHQ